MGVIRFKESGLFFSYQYNSLKLGKPGMSSFYLTTNSLNLHYTVVGQGTPALLVHGHASSRNIWTRIITTYLGQRYRCYTLDLPGHGQSTQPPQAWFTLENYTQTLSAFCNQLGLKDILLAGHSMGGLLCLNFALTYPHRVKNLILVAPAVEGSFLAYLDPLLKMEGLFPHPLAEHLLKIYNANRWLGAPIGLNWYARPGMIWTDSFKQAQADFACCPLSTLLGNLKLMRSADLREQLPCLRPPTLAITGDRDRVVPPSQAKLIAGRAPQVSLAVVPQSGHLPFDEQPALFETTVREYLARKDI